MSEVNVDLMLAVISLLTAIGSFFGQAAMTKYRLEQVEKKVEKKADKEDGEDLETRMKALEEARIEDGKSLVRIETKLDYITERIEKMSGEK